MNLIFDDAINKGANIIYQTNDIPKNGYFFRPSIIDNINSSMKAYNCETFGPLFSIYTFQEESEAISLANDTPYGLGGSVWSKNLKNAEKDLDKLVKKVKSDLNKDFKSIVFHDAYQYIEERFNVNVMGAFTVNTDVMPGAEQLAEIREIIEHDKVSCIFSEPQFNPDIINAVAKDMNIKTGVLDPLGATLEPGKDLYFDLIKNMSKSFKGC